LTDPTARGIIGLSAGETPQHTKEEYDMGVNITEYKVTYNIKVGKQFRVGPSYGFDHAYGVIEIDYVGLINQDIHDSHTDIEVYLDGQEDPDNMVWVGYHYTQGEEADDTSTRYCPAYAIENNIWGM
jgi:hypothetical protein